MSVDLIARENLILARSIAPHRPTIAVNCNDPDVRRFVEAANARDARSPYRGSSHIAAAR